MNPVLNVSCQIKFIPKHRSFPLEAISPSIDSKQIWQPFSKKNGKLNFFFKLPGVLLLELSTSWAYRIIMQMKAKKRKRKKVKVLRIVFSAIKCNKRKELSTPTNIARYAAWSEFITVWHCASSDDTPAFWLQPASRMRNALSRDYCGKGRGSLRRSFP